MKPRSIALRPPALRPALLAMAALASSCVLPPQEEASPISVPDDLLTTTTTTPPVTETPAGDTEFELTLYWHLNDAEARLRLVPIRRPSDVAISHQDALTQLVSGPNDTEIAELSEVGTLVPVAEESLAPTVVVEAGVAAITVADEFGFRANDQIKISLAEELVCTMTGFDDVGGVVVLDSAGPIPLPDGRAETITGPAARDDYACDVPVTDEASEDDTGDDEG